MKKGDLRLDYAGHFVTFIKINNATSLTRKVRENIQLKNYSVSTQKIQVISLYEMILLFSKMSNSLRRQIWQGLISLSAFRAWSNLSEPSNEGKTCRPISSLVAAVRVSSFNIPCKQFKQKSTLKFVKLWSVFASAATRKHKSSRRRFSRSQALSILQPILRAKRWK